MASNDLNGGDYFASYADVQVHELMLKDRPRTVAYRRFIEENREYVHGKVVMDVGAGTGILSLFAATAGAKKVYAVEASSVALLCKEVVTDNDLDEVIEVIHDKVENVKLPEGTQVDIIVSEWMGFYLLHESMLDSVIYARDKFLAPSGILVPSRACLYVAPVDMSQHFEERAAYWSNIYGFDFSPIASSINMAEVSQPLIQYLDVNSVKSPPQKLLEFNLKTVTQKDVESFSKTMEFSMTEESRIHGFGFWFDVLFEKEIKDFVNTEHKSSSEHSKRDDCVDSCKPVNSIDPSGDAKCMMTQANDTSITKDNSSLPSFLSPVPSVCLPTGPLDPQTHWKQTIIFLPQTIMVTEGISLLCTVTMAQDSSNKRHYNITLALGDGRESYEEQGGEIDSDVCSVGDSDSDDSTEHPTPCHCESNRCRLIAALIEKYDTEHHELEDEAENVETEAEVEAAKEIDAQIENEGWPMDSSNVDTGDD